MDAASKSPRGALLATALAPVVPQIIGSIFNIWYNASVVNPLLGTDAMRARFMHTIIFYNAASYPLAVGLWIGCVLSLRPAWRALLASSNPSALDLAPARRRLLQLPWAGSAIAAAGWFLCVPVFLWSLAAAGPPLDSRLFWHLPISFAVSGTIAVTHSFFLIEITTQRRLYPLFFQNSRPDKTPGARPLSLRGRGVLWAVSACVCPLLSLVLLSFAPKSPGSEWFELFVAVVGIAFSIYSALLINRLVAEPVDHLREAVIGVAAGNLEANVPVRRADEIGVLAAEVNRMIAELRSAESVRQTFGLHVGRKVVERLLARDPRSGAEETITVMFVDIRDFTARSKGRTAVEVVAGLNEFLAVMVEIVESRHGGMINKFLGDGFMALFGADEEGARAEAAVAAGREMLAALVGLNARLTARGEAALAIGIGLNTGPAVVGSIGSRDRMEFTAIGSTVNIASRIEGLTKQIGVPLLFTEATRDHLTSTAREVGAHAIRGVVEPVRLFTV